VCPPFFWSPPSSLKFFSSGGFMFVFRLFDGSSGLLPFTSPPLASVQPGLPPHLLPTLLLVMWFAAPMYFLTEGRAWLILLFLPSRVILELQLLPSSSPHRNCQVVQCLRFSAPPWSRGGAGGSGCRLLAFPPFLFPTPSGSLYSLEMQCLNARRTFPA